MDLKELEYHASVCKSCELHNGQITPVFARGKCDANIVICGMCPGPEENKDGVPFVGSSGGLLDTILLNAFGDKHDNVYITNVVKCFVQPGIKLDICWMTACLPYLIIQLKLINPKVVISLGKDVSNFLLGNKFPMKAIRGKLFDYIGDIKVLSTYHPSYLLRGGGTKHKHFKTVVDDFKQIAKYV